MKTNSKVTAIALALMMIATMQNNAQFGGLLNKVKQQAKNDNERPQGTRAIYALRTSARCATSNYRKYTFGQCSCNIPAQGSESACRYSKQGNQAGRKLANDKNEEYVNVKVIFMGNKWKTFKDHNWPYRVMGSALPCALITQVNGKHYLYDCTSQKNKKGTSYIMIDNGADKQPVQMN